MYISPSPGTAPRLIARSILPLVPRRRPHRVRFPGRDRFAACNGTAPIEVSSGNRKIYRLSRRGNRRLNRAIHMAAVTQVSHRHSEGRASQSVHRVPPQGSRNGCPPSLQELAERMVSGRTLL